MSFQFIGHFMEKIDSFQEDFFFKLFFSSQKVIPPSFSPSNSKTFLFLQFLYKLLKSAFRRHHGNRGNSAEIKRKVPFQNKEI